MDKKDLKCIISQLKSQFNIGKEGINDNFVDTVDKYLEAHKVVKIKSLVAKNKEELAMQAQDIANRTDSEVAEKKGYTFVLIRD